MKTILCLLAVCLSTLFAGAAQPKIGTTEVMKAASGNGTNTSMFTTQHRGISTNDGVNWYLPTNIVAKQALGTLTGTIGTHHLSASGNAFAGMARGGNIVVGPGSLNQQYVISKIISASSIMTEGQLVQTYTAFAGLWDYYPPAQIFSDVTGATFPGFIDSAGSYGITGLPESFGMMWLCSDGSNNWRSTVEPSGVWQLQSMRGGDGAPIHVYPGALFEGLVMMPNGTYFRWPTTNFATATFSNQLFAANMDSNASPVNTLGQLASGQFVKIANGSGSGGSTNWLTDANGNGYGVNFFALKDRNGIALMQLWSPTSTNGGNASMEIYGGGVSAPFKVTGNEYVTQKLGVNFDPSAVSANLEVAGTPGATNTIFHAGTNSANGLTVTTNGNVGIGTATPLSLLHVAASGVGIHFAGWPSDTGYGAIGFNGALSGAGNFTLKGAAGVGTALNAPSGQSLTLSVNAVAGLTLSSGLNVGIGTTVPRHPLEVAGTIAITNTGGGLKIGGGNATVTNILGNSASLDFPSTLAGSFSDLPITVTGVTSNGCHVSPSYPWQSASGGGNFTTYNSNDTVYVRFANNNLTLAIDPSPGTFSVLVFKTL